MSLGFSDPLVIDPRGVSIGVELEACFQLSSPEDKTMVLSEVHDILRVAMWRGVGIHGLLEVPQQSKALKLDEVRRLAEGNFVVRSDERIIPNDEAKEYGVRITTPVFNNRAWEKFMLVMMDGLQSSGRFKFNHTTGLNIHVGKERGEKFSLEELKRVSKAIVLFERHMSATHPIRDPSKKTGPELISYSFCNETPRLKDLSTKEKIGLIESISEESILFDCMNYDGGDSTGKRYTYNLRSNDRFGTIEFRQAAGTLDYELTNYWIRGVITFVWRACRTGEVEFLEMAEYGIKEGDYVAFGLPFRHWTEHPGCTIPCYDTDPDEDL